jgi:hypothetical protein
VSKGLDKEIVNICYVFSWFSLFQDTMNSFIRTFCLSLVRKISKFLFLCVNEIINFASVTFSRNITYFDSITQLFVHIPTVEKYKFASDVSLQLSAIDICMLLSHK